MMAAINPMTGIANSSCIQKKEAVPAGRIFLGQVFVSGSTAGMYGCPKFWGDGEDSETGKDGAAVSVFLSEGASCASGIGVSEERSVSFVETSEGEASG